MFFLPGRQSAFLQQTHRLGMIWINNEVDSWSATLIDPGMNENVKVFIKPGGSHSTRINNLPEGQKEEVLSLIRDWLERDGNPSISY